MNLLSISLVLLFTFYVIFATPIDQIKDNKNQTISEIVNQQTDAIKKIVASQKQVHIEYPVVTRKEAETKDVEDKKVSPEELALKCKQYLYQQQMKEKVVTPPPVQERIDNSQYKYGPEEKLHSTLVRPQYFVQKTVFPTIKPEPKSTTTVPLDSKIKLIKFEPVILQKNIMKDGQVVYYWHKSLPFPQYLAMKQQESASPTEDPQSSFYRKHLSHGRPQYNYPTYVSALEQKTTTSTTTTQKPTTEAVDESVYVNKLKFIVPVSYPNEDMIPKYPTDFDQFAYYPKEFQPQRMNIEVPYQPSFPMMQTLVIPNKYVQKEEDSLENVHV